MSNLHLGGIALEYSGLVAYSENTALTGRSGLALVTIADRAIISCQSGLWVFGATSLMAGVAVLTV